MRDLVVLFLHLIVSIVRLIRPGGARSIVAESVLVKQQLLILNRSRKRSPNLRASDRIVAGLCGLLIHPVRLMRCAIILKPSTLLSFHQALKNRKYRLLFSARLRKKPGPKGPGQEVIAAVVEMKQRNPTWGCPRIAQQIALAFGIEINKDSGSSDSGHSIQARTRLRPFMAYLPRSRQGLIVEPGFVSM
jgi:putative transposase